MGGLPRDGHTRSDQGIRLPGQRRRRAGLRRARTREPGYDPQRGHRDNDHAEPADDRFRAAPGREILGRASGNGGGRGVQPEARCRSESGRLLLERLRPRQVDNRDRADEGSDHSLQAGLLARGRAVLACRRGCREGVRAKERREIRHGDRRHDVLRPIHGVVVEDRPGSDLRAEPELLGQELDAAEAEEARACRRARRRDADCRSRNGLHLGHLPGRPFDAGATPEELAGEDLPGPGVRD